MAIQARHAHDPDRGSVRRPLPRRLDSLAPGASAQAVLEAAGWPDGIAKTVLVIGHQPTLGHVAALLMTGHQAEWSVKKSGIWWFQSRSRNGDGQTVLRAVINPDLCNPGFLAAQAP